MTISMNQLETYGLTVKQIVQEMDEIFPPLSPTLYDTHAAIMYKAGQRSVVEWLYKKLEE